jgi:hypothetical protein
MSNVSTYLAIKKEGDFCITQTGTKFNFIQFCPKFGICDIQIHQKPADDKKAIWNWNGNYEKPVIRPSIGCDVAPRCGKHVTIGQ